MSASGDKDITEPVWLIAGPTASGKSGLALALAERTGGEIVNADSMQVYTDLAVLTARPQPDELERARHHLYGVVDGAEPWSVGLWLRAAKDAIEDIAARGRQPIVVGGTGLYFTALTQGLSDIPPVAEAVRAAQDQIYRVDGEAVFRRRLFEVDPAAEVRIEIGDRQRLVRAMAVFESSGRTLSEWQQSKPAPVLAAWRGLVLQPPREQLYTRCDQRLAAMVEHGALGEVKRLLLRGLDPGLPIMKALGVPELALYLTGTATLDEAIGAAAQSTRRYAKRQTTWFRHQTGDWPRLEDPDFDAAYSVLSGQIHSRRA